MQSDVIVYCVSTRKLSANVASKLLAKNGHDSEVIEAAIEFASAGELDGALELLDAGGNEAQPAAKAKPKATTSKAKPKAKPKAKAKPIDAFKEAFADSSKGDNEKVAIGESVNVVYWDGQPWKIQGGRSRSYMTIAAVLALLADKDACEAIKKAAGIQ